MKSNRLTTVLVVFAVVLAASALLGHPLIAPDYALALGAIPMMFGETTPVAQVLELIEKQGRAWEEFKTANDARIKAIEEKGYAPADVVEKVDKINKELADINKAYAELEKKANRPQPGADGKEMTPEQAEYSKAFGEWLRTGRERPDMKELGARALKSMNSLTDSAGGYLILPEMDMAIDRIAPTISAMYRLANTVTIGKAKYTKRVKTSGMAIAWVAQGSGNGETTEPNFARIEIDAHTGEIEPWVDQETLDDADIDLEVDLANEAAIGFAEGVGAAFITGNGVGRPRGIMSYTAVANASYAWGNVGYIASGKSGAFTSVAPADAVVDLQHALKAQYRPGAVFLTNDATLATMRQFKDASGSYYLWNPDPSAGFGGRFLGSPVEIDDNIAAVSAGSYSLAYGNFKRGYTIVNRKGTTLLRDPYTTKGVVKFNFRRRVGGGITHYEAIKLMKFATS